MRTGSSLSMPAPSSSLLRFLKSQSEAICFFTSSPATVCQNARPVRSWTPLQHDRKHFFSPSRCLTTSPSRQVNLESSLFSFDFLRPPPRYRLRPIHGPPYGSACNTSSYSSADTGTNSRWVSTDSRTLLKRLWKPHERQEEKNLKSTNLPPLPGFLDDVGGTSLSRKQPGKAANELKLRCTEFDKEGKVTFMDGEFKKTELIAKVWTLK